MFKSGDKVICINSKNTNHLKRAHVYTVSMVFESSEIISLTELNQSFKYHSFRFIKKYKNEFSVNDKIALIDNSGDITLKKGKIYTVSNYHMLLDKYDEIITNVSLYENVGEFDCDRFIHLKKYRKLKLENLCSK